MADTYDLGVRLFASVRETLGRDRLEVRLPTGARVVELREQIVDAHPQLADAMRFVAVAVNQEIAPPERVLSAGDEVALIPPVGGG